MEQSFIGRQNNPFEERWGVFVCGGGKGSVIVGGESWSE